MVLKGICLIVMDFDGIEWILTDFDGLDFDGFRLVLTDVNGF